MAFNFAWQLSVNAVLADFNPARGNQVNITTPVVAGFPRNTNTFLNPFTHSASPEFNNQNAVGTLLEATIATRSSHLLDDVLVTQTLKIDRHTPNRFTVALGHQTQELGGVFGNSIAFRWGGAFNGGHVFKEAMLSIVFQPVAPGMLLTLGYS